MSHAWGITAYEKSADILIKNILTGINKEGNDAANFGEKTSFLTAFMGSRNESKHMADLLRIRWHRIPLK